MEEADQLCDRVAIMDHGRLLALDTPESLKATVGADTEVRMQAAGDLAVARRTPRGTARRSTAAGSSTTPVHVMCGAAVRHCPSSSRTPTAAASTITDVGVTEPTLETVFISLTGKDLRE